jgi:hypothetical protein
MGRIYDKRIMVGTAPGGDGAQAATKFLVIATVAALR